MLMLAPCDIDPQRHRAIHAQPSIHILFSSNRHSHTSSSRSSSASCRILMHTSRVTYPSSRCLWLLSSSTRSSTAFTQRASMPLLGNHSLALLIQTALHWQDPSRQPHLIHCSTAFNEPDMLVRQHRHMQHAALLLRSRLSSTRSAHHQHISQHACFHSAHTALHGSLADHRLFYRATWQGKTSRLSCNGG
ncbi:hypothetical protein BC831DRAFT_449544 [Entophlyctis helioformis]|nr:hypothetical protein BC831DRAFT_449544 [Entophlyctis helioformis]